MVRERLAELGLDQRAGHQRQQGHAAVRRAARATRTPTRSATLAQRDRPGADPSSSPTLVVWKMTKSLRPGKVLLDWSQNTAAKTTIAPYSLRGKDAPFVAAPRTWEEVERGAERPGRLEQLQMDEVLRRVSGDGDLFGQVLAG